MNDCEFKNKCAFGNECNLKCFETENKDSIEFHGKIYSYKNNEISILEKRLYQGTDGNWYPYSGNTVQGTGTREIWELIKCLTGLNRLC